MTDKNKRDFLKGLKNGSVVFGTIAAILLTFFWIAL